MEVASLVVESIFQEVYQALFHLHECAGLLQCTYVLEGWRVDNALQEPAHPQLIGHRITWRPSSQHPYLTNIFLKLLEVQAVYQNTHGATCCIDKIG